MSNKYNDDIITSSIKGLMQLSDEELKKYYLITYDDLKNGLESSNIAIKLFLLEAGLRKIKL